MKKIGILCILSLLVGGGCAKKNTSIWDSTTQLKTKKGQSLWESSQDMAASTEIAEPSSEEFIPLKEEDLKAQLSDVAVPQPMHSPGEVESGLPGIERFLSPSSNLAAVFRTVYFNTDDHILRGKDSLRTIEEISSYLKTHPNTYIFVEGHCDERGPEAYNLALGTRRANFIRALLVKKGVNLNQVHTISFGKEKPIAFGHNPESWAKNRRGQFKIFQKGAK